MCPCCCRRGDGFGRGSASTPGCATSSEWTRSTIRARTSRPASRGYARTESTSSSTALGVEIPDAGLASVAPHARIVICGVMSAMNDFGQRPGIRNYPFPVLQRASMRGFLVFDYLDRASEAIGLPANRVTWTADADPSADHDIVSVDADGSELWVEVKSTTGRDGQSSWTAAEFRLPSGLAAATSSTASSKRAPPRRRGRASAIRSAHSKPGNSVATSTVSPATPALWPNPRSQHGRTPTARNSPARRLEASDATAVRQKLHRKVHKRCTGGPHEVHAAADRRWAIPTPAGHRAAVETRPLARSSPGSSRARGGCLRKRVVI